LTCPQAAYYHPASIQLLVNLFPDWGAVNGIFKPNTLEFEKGSFFGNKDPV